MHEVAGIRTKPTMLAIAGVASYWAWLHIMSLPFAGSISNTIVAPREGGMFQLPFFLFGLVAMVILYKRSPLFDRQCNSMSYVVCASLAMTIGGFLVRYSGLLIGAVGGMALIAAGSLVSYALIGKLCAFFDYKHEMPIMFYGGLLLSFLLYLMTLILPGRLSLIVLLALPSISMACLKCASKVEPIGTVPIELQNTMEKLSHKGWFGVPPIFCVYRFVFALTLTYLQGTVLSGSTVSPFITCTATIIILGLIVSIEFLTYRKEFDIAPLLVVVLVCSALMFTLTENRELLSILPILSVVGYFLYLAVAHLKFGQYINGLVGCSPSKVMAVSTAVSTFGLLAGYLLGILQACSNASMAIGIIIVWCVFAASLWLFPVRITEYLLLRTTPRTEPSFTTSEHVADLIVSVQQQSQRVAEEFQLSAREEEILNYLIRGWELQSIAEAEFISRNTVKTHVGHIYSKIGVHTREELVMLVESLGERG